MAKTDLERKAVMDDIIIRIIHNARAGSRKAFEALFNAYHNRIYMLAPHTC